MPHNAQRKHVFLGKIKQMSKSKKLPPRKKVALKILHQILGQISTISFMSGDTANIWEDIELRIDTEPFCTSCQIYSIKKRLGLKIHYGQRHLPSGFYGYNTINSTKKLRSDTNFSN